MCVLLLCALMQMKAMCVCPTLLLVLLLLGPWPAGAYRTPFDQRPEEARGRPEDRSHRDGPADGRYAVVLTCLAWSDVYTSNSMTGGFKHKMGCWFMDQNVFLTTFSTHLNTFLSRGGTSVKNYCRCKKHVRRFVFPERKESL